MTAIVRFFRSFALITMIVAASLAGQQVLEALPQDKLWLLPPGAGGVLLAVPLLCKNRPQRTAAIGGMMVVVSIVGLLLWLHILRLAELTHIVMFAALGASLAHLSPKLALGIVVTIAAGDEALQAFLPYRVGSLADVALNIASGIPGYFAWVYCSNERRQRPSG